ncbi:hypothetical protein LY76DRAFT_381643 [Colletotrichum caudatum]|nr:hypothetical protein LY76DRAFT_381643 [Colletotrichum caudatum]
MNERQTGTAEVSTGSGRDQESQHYTHQDAKERNWQGQRQGMQHQQTRHRQMRLYPRRDTCPWTSMDSTETSLDLAIVERGESATHVQSAACRRATEAFSDTHSFTGKKMRDFGVDLVCLQLAALAVRSYRTCEGSISTWSAISPLSSSVDGEADDAALGVNRKSFINLAFLVVMNANSRVMVDDGAKHVKVAP